jgi:phosphoglycolate phosphatase-like HAD superfamily hydrolase
MIVRPMALELDAMGVVFSAADDVVELLIPFVRERGGVANADAVQAAYVEASLGTITADTFWLRVGLRPSLEDDYLAGHSVAAGAFDALKLAEERGVPVWLLSNDVERWSRKLRAAFGLEALLSGSVISSDARVRKPDPAIYRYFLQRSGYGADQVLFVDDREKNVAAAGAIGMRALQFGGDVGFGSLTKLLRGAT